MQTQLKVGLLDFCGIPDTRLEIFYAALENAAAAQSVILQAQKLGTEF
jgi:NAD(P)H dehydrogenase (quinone)